jgi:hypothetical protein
MILRPSGQVLLWMLLAKSQIIATDGSRDGKDPLPDRCAI